MKSKKNVTVNTKISKLPRYSRYFIYSYFVLLLATLGGFIGAAISSNLIVLICTILVLISLIISIVVACL